MGRSGWRIIAICFHVGTSVGQVNIQPSGDLSFCLDLPGEDTSPGTGLWMWECNGHPSQNWIVDDKEGNVRYATDPSKCIDVAEESALGAHLQLWDCNSLPDQNFMYNNASQVLSLQGKLCMDLPGNEAYKGVLMWLWECNGEESQKFILDNAPSPQPAPSPTPSPTPPSPSGAVTINPAHDQTFCLDLPGGDTALGGQVWMWECNGHPSQNWIVDEDAGNIKFAEDSSKCIDAAEIAKGAQLQLWDCNGLDQQKFVYDTEAQTLSLKPGSSQNASLHNASSQNASFCLDVPGGDVSQGDLMWIWECNGMESQMFTLSQAPSPTPSPPAPPPGPPTPQCSGPPSETSGDLETYGAPSSSFPSGPFNVSVQHRVSDVHSTFVYHSSAQSDAPDAQQGRTASWTTFSFTGSVTVKAWPQHSWQEVVVRPLSLGISVCRDGDAAVFTMTEPGHLSVEFDGDTQNSLLVFGELPEDDEDKIADVVFEQGEHDIDTYYVDADTTIRLEGGAWVRGHFVTKNNSAQNNIRIVGRGVLSGEHIPHKAGGGDADDSKGMLNLCGDDITIKGITIVNPPTYLVNVNPYWLGCEGTRTLVEGVKAMGWYFTTDGIMVGRDSTVRGNFVRANDDSLKLYMSNTVWEKNTIWQGDNGQSFMLSWNTDTPEKNITVKDCIVVHVEHQADYGDSPPARPAVFGSVHGGAGLISQFHFENIVVEGPVFRPFAFSQAKNPWGGSGTGTISDVILDGISFTGPAQSNSVINGHISQVAFNGLTYEGELVSSASDGHFDVSLGASDITFSPGPVPPESTTPAPTTPAPTTPASTTQERTTPEPTMPSPTSPALTTAEPATTPAPSTPVLSTPVPSTPAPTTPVPSSTLPPAPAPDPSGAVTINPVLNRSYCLDLPGGDASLGSQLWMWECTGDPSQSWIVDEDAGNIRFAGDSSKCVDVTNGNTVDGTVLQLWDCLDLPQQNIQYYEETQTFWLADDAQSPFCVDVPGGEVYQGNLMWIWECNGAESQTFTKTQSASTSQNWKLPQSTWVAV